MAIHSGFPATTGQSTTGTMQAVVYDGGGHVSWAEAPRPSLEADTDVIVQVDAVTICGTDLHILGGDVPEVAAGYGLCRGGGGWILGHTIDGTQAEYVRVPFADRSTYAIPAGVTDEEVLMLADIGPTGYEVGVLNGKVRPGDTVVVVGAGPIGLSAIQSARLFSPSWIIAVDIAPARLEAARRFGADVVVDSSEDDPGPLVGDFTDGLGADVVIEAVGTAATFELCGRLVRPGGRIANVGVHGSPVTLHLEQLWSRDVTISTGLVDTASTPTLMRLLQRRLLATKGFVTHRFAMNDFAGAYDVFARAGDMGALKVVLTR